jgi:hypothetical protein
MRRFLGIIITLTLTLGLLAGCGGGGTSADTVMLNGTIYTMDEAGTIAEAVAIKDGKILAVGTTEAIEAYVVDSTEVLDLKGQTVYPGFFDSHMHPAMSAVNYVFAVVMSDVTGVDNYVAKIKEFAEANPNLAVIEGSGYYRSDWDHIGPRKETLDAIDATRPIIITSGDGHSRWVNSKALEMASIDKNTPDPAGGVIQRDPATGEPSGLLQESAMGLVAELEISYTKDQYKEALLWAQEFFNSKGITNVFDAWVPTDNPNYYEAYQELATEGLLSMRVTGGWYLDPEMGEDAPAIIDAAIEKSESFSTPYFKVNTFKFFADQVIEEETGLLLEPYAHRDDNWYGIKVWEDTAMQELMEKIDAAGFQIHVHSIGDGSSRYLLDIFEAVRDTNGPRDSRHTLAHCQLMADSDQQRMAEMGMTAVVAPYWMMVDDYFWNLYYPYLGEQRANLQYPYKSLIDYGVNTTIHSDFFVTEPDYAWAFYTAQTRKVPQDVFEALYGGEGVTRATEDASPLVAGVFSDLPLKEQRVSLEDAIRSATINGAKQVFTEASLGSIEVGKAADFAIFAKDFAKIDLEEYYTNPCAMTIFEGKIVFPKMQ